VVVSGTLSITETICDESFYPLTEAQYVIRVNFALFQNTSLVAVGKPGDELGGFGPEGHGLRGLLLDPPALRSPLKNVCRTPAFISTP
jgi:hypothetical protein